MPEKGQDYVLEVAAPTAKGATVPLDADFSTVGYVRSQGVAQSVETIDTSSNTDPDNTSAIPGQKSFNFSSDGLFVYDDAGQTAIQDALDNQASDSFPWFRLTNNVSGANEYVGQVIITELAGPEMGTNEVATFSLSTEGVGALTINTIA